MTYSEQIKAKIKLWRKHPSDPSLFRVLSIPSFVFSLVFISYVLHWHWDEAIGIMLSFWAHENAHAVPLWLVHNIKYGMIYTVLGAATSSELEKRLGLNHFANVEVAALGPIVSLLLALVFILIGLLAEALGFNPYLYQQLAGFNAALACINLVPFPRGTDGGKIVRWLLASCDDNEDKLFLGLSFLVTLVIAGVMYFANFYLFCLLAFTIVVGSLNIEKRDNPADSQSIQSMGNQKERIVAFGYSFLLVLSFIVVWLAPTYDAMRVARLILRLE